MTRSSIGRVILEEFAQSMSDVAVIDNPPKMEGRSMVMFLMPNASSKGSGSKNSPKKNSAQTETAPSKESQQDPA